MKIKITTEKTRAKDLKAGDLFTTAPQEYCDNCVSATHPYYARKHPRQKWCSKISQFVTLDGYCDLWADPKLKKKTATNNQQLELNLKGCD